MRHRLGGVGSSDWLYWGTVVRALQRGFTRNSPRKRLEPVHTRLTDCICAYWVQEAPKYVTSVLSETDGQVAEKAQGGAAEHGETLIEVNEKKTEAADQEDYLSELESLFEVGNGPTLSLIHISEPTRPY